MDSPPNQNFNSAAPGPQASITPTKPKRQISLNIPMILAGLLLISTIALGLLSINYANKYTEAKTDVDGQKAAAAAAAKEEQKVVDQKEHEEMDKQPYRTYQAPAVLGAIQAEFPKNWNVYAKEEEKSDIQLDVYMYPGVVRDENSTTEPYSFRIRMQQKLYPEAMLPYQKRVEKGQLKAQTVTVSGISGTRFDGAITDERTGAIILLPVRDKTLFIWTESPTYMTDYDQIVAKMAISP